MLRDNVFHLATACFARWGLAGDPCQCLGELEADRLFLNAIEGKIGPVPEFRTKELRFDLAVWGPPTRHSSKNLKGPTADTRRGTGIPAQSELGFAQCSQGQRVR